MIEREADAIGRHRAEQAEAGRVERPEDRLRHLDDEMGGVVAVLVEDAGQRRQRPR
ncbi:hypothetical protein D3C86_2161550 [compost metagenome]